MGGILRSVALFLLGFVAGFVYTVLSWLGFCRLGLDPFGAYAFVFTIALVVAGSAWVLWSRKSFATGYIIGTIMPHILFIVFLILLGFATLAEPASGPAVKIG